MKSVILARVSSKEQEDGHSLDAQLNNLKTYCLRNNLEIIKKFSFVESSTKGKRVKFNEMLNFCKKQKEKVALVCDKVDRMQRDFKESIILTDYIKNDSIELHFVRKGKIIKQDSKSIDILMWDFAVLGAKSYVLNLSDNVKRTQEKKLKEGTILGEAPLGYLNLKDGKGGVILDPERAFIIKRIFQEYGTGLYSLHEIANKTIEWGLKSKRKNENFINKEQVRRILKNPFYYGYMKIKGILYPHIYQPLITKQLWNQCQSIMEGRKVNYSKQTKIDFIFKGLIRCKNCNCMVSPYIKKSKYIYLRPNSKAGCNCRQISEKYALKRIEKILNSIKIPDEILNFLKATIKSSFENKKEQHNQSIQALQKQYNKIQNKFDNLLEMRLEQSITKDIYDKKALEFKTEQNNIQERLKNFTNADEEFSITLEYLLDLASRSNDLFKSSRNEKKRKIIKFVFSNLSLNGSKLEYSMHSPFDKLVNIGKRQVWRE